VYIPQSSDSEKSLINNMRLETLLTLTFATFTLARDDDPASQDAAASAAEDICYAKTLATGSGAAAAITGFCAQVENNDYNTDNPASAGDTAVNGYTAGGFDPSGVKTTARLAISNKSCSTDLGDENDCLTGFWEACSSGDQYGRGVQKKGCLEMRIE
jgi:hypothetical protein